MSEESEKQIRELLPKTLDLSEFDIWSCDYWTEGIDDFTGAAMKKNFRIKLVARDYRMELTLYLDRKK